MEKYLVRKVYLSFIGLVIMGLMLFYSGNSVWAQAKKSSYVPPKTIYWGCRYVGASLYTIPATIADKIGPVLGSKIRLIPGEDVDMINMLHAKKVHLSTFASDCYWASMGLANYSTFALGPQPIRIIWPGLPTGSGLTGIATKVSGIKTPYDLKGKRLGRVVGASWSDMCLRGSLAFGNLTVNDATILDLSSTGASYKALAEGKVDATFGSVTGPGMYEAEAGPHGVYVMRYPFEDKEGWARFKKYMPYAFPGYSIKGAGIKPGEKIPTIMYPWPITNTIESQPDELVYAICKAIYAKMDEIVAAYEPNEAMRVERAIIPEAVLMAPFHPGAIKFFKEIKVWTPALEEANKRQLAHLEKVNKRWAAFVEEAEEEMAKTGKKIDPTKEWTVIVEKEIGFLP